eukprot:6448819-Prorocentrum_lima.AAC.1
MSRQGYCLIAQARQQSEELTEENHQLRAELQRLQDQGSRTAATEVVSDTALPDNDEERTS